MAEAAIRRGTPEDAPACAAILNDWIDATTWMPRVHPHEDVERHYRDVVFPKQAVLVFGDPLQGFLALDEDRCVTALFCKSPGSGVGTALLGQAKANSDTLWLWTFEANEGARRFYDREGFVQTEFTTGLNEEELPDLRFEWRRAGHA
jgi:GNAT superfamily N-acetyltransferase